MTTVFQSTPGRHAPSANVGFPTPGVGDDLSAGSFGAVFADVSSSKPDDGVEAVASKAEIALMLKMLMLYELLGIPIPESMIKKFAALGMKSVVSTCLAHNKALKLQRVEEMHEQMRQAQRPTLRAPERHRAAG